MMKFLLVLAFVAAASAYSSVEYQNLFTEWMGKYQRAYTSEEFSARFEIFKANADFVSSWNVNPENTHQVELNQFADISNDEYQRIYLGTRITVSDDFPQVLDMAPAAATIDWRTKGYVTGVKDQGQCGSCWSFSTTGSTEAAHFKATGNLVSLSEQNLMDCSTSYGNAGCEGGLMDSAFKYIIANKGLDTEASYAYTAKDGTACKFTTANIGATLTSYKNVAKGSESGLVTAINIQPVSVAIDASKSSFQLYKSGVYYEPTCSSSRLDHGVLAVGYGTDNGTNADYYLVKNSWGTGWGLDGYLMMSRNKSNNCGIATSASYPIA